MPFKCLECDKVVQNIEDQECSCKTPNFIKCEVVHLMHPEGTGRIIAKRKVSIGIPTEKPRVEDQPLRICCSNMDHIPIVTGVRTTITCPECLDFIDSLEQE